MCIVLQTSLLNITFIFLQSQGKKISSSESSLMKWLFLLAAFLCSDSLIPFKKRQLDKTMRITKAVYVGTEWELKCHGKVKCGIMSWYISIVPLLITLHHLSFECGSLWIMHGWVCCKGKQYSEQNPYPWEDSKIMSEGHFFYSRLDMSSFNPSLQLSAMQLLP